MGIKVTREQAAKLTREELDKWNLKDWGVRLNPVDLEKRFQYLGLCSYKDKVIIINAHHIDLHDEKEITNTIRHEIAHALTPGHMHDTVWADKAREVGCINVAPCSHLSLPPDVVDAIRSGADVEVSFEEEIIRRPKYQITRLQDRCEVCNKVAVQTGELVEEVKDPFKPDKKYIWLECGHIIVKYLPKGTPFHLIVTNAARVKDCKHEWEKNKCVNCGEYKLFPFQVEAMQFIEAGLAVNKGAGSFDEMGLGKTPEAIGVVKFHSELWPFLLLCPQKIKFQWFKEFLRWAGDDFLCQIINTSKDVLIPGLKGYIASYDMLVPKVRTRNGKMVTQGFDIEKFKKIGIKCIIMDECFKIKNPDATRTQQVRKIIQGDVKVIPLSGWPWNKGGDFFTVLNMLDPRRFSSHQGYKDRWVDYYWQGSRRKEGGINNPERFKEYVKDLFIRRERKEVMPELPPTNRSKIPVQLEEFQQGTYDESVSDFVKWYNQAIIDGVEEQLSEINILAKLSRLRHLTGLAKIPATVEYACEFIENTNTNLVIYVHHIDVGTILYDKLKEALPNIQVLKLTSTMSPIECTNTVEKFNSQQSVVVMSTLGAGIGTDGLQKSCYTCVLHERQWNPSDEQQAEDRLNRIGQTSPVIDARYVEAEDTVDQQYDQIVEPKRLGFHKTMNKGQAPQWNTGDLAKELAEAIVKRHNEKNKHKVKKELVAK